MTRVSVPLMPCLKQGRFFSTISRNYRFPGALLGFRWPACSVLDGPHLATLAHHRRKPKALYGRHGPLGEALMTRVAHHIQRRFWRRWIRRARESVCDRIALGLGKRRAPIWKFSRWGPRAGVNQWS